MPLNLNQQKPAVEIPETRDQRRVTELEQAIHAVAAESYAVASVLGLLLVGLEAQVENLPVSKAAENARRLGSLSAVGEVRDEVAKALLRRSELPIRGM